MSGFGSNLQDTQCPLGIRELLHGAGKHTEEIHTLTYRHRERSSTCDTLDTGCGHGARNAQRP